MYKKIDDYEVNFEISGLFYIKKTSENFKQSDKYIEYVYKLTHFKNIESSS